jgi:hypothetical protein
VRGWIDNEARHTPNPAIYSDYLVGLEDVDNHDGEAIRVVLPDTGPAGPGGSVSDSPEHWAGIRGQMALTGAEITGLVVSAVVILGLGVVLFLVARRRREPEEDAVG